MRIACQRDLEEMVQDWGFVPLFKNGIEGFSVEENVLPELWFSDEQDGPWEWKGPVIRAADCAYGKFFRGKAGFISRIWYPDFANFRRDGYDADARYDDGLLGKGELDAWRILQEEDSLISKDWRGRTGIAKRGEFDGIVNRLQMLGYVTTVDFEYARSRQGEQYGWGLARYATPERHWGAEFEDKVYEREPEESLERILAHLKKLLPNAQDDALRKLVG